MELLGKGVYTLGEAAQFARLPHSTIHAWFRPNPKDGGSPAFESDLPAVEGDLAISFHDLVDVLVAGHMRSHEMPLPRIRQWYRTLQARWNMPHPFCHQKLRLDCNKRQLFMELKHLEGLTDFAAVLSSPQYNQNVIEPFLQQIDYEEQLARAWRIHKGVILDPRVSFGKPTLEGRGTTTKVVYQEYLANDRDAEFVARLYRISPESVLDAVAFETDCQKAAA